MSEPLTREEQANAKVVRWNAAIASLPFSWTAGVSRKLGQLSGMYYEVQQENAALSASLVAAQEALREAVIALEEVHEGLFISSERAGMSKDTCSTVATFAKTAALAGSAVLAGTAERQEQPVEAGGDRSAFAVVEEAGSAASSESSVDPARAASATAGELKSADNVCGGPGLADRAALPTSRRCDRDFLDDGSCDGVYDETGRCDQCGRPPVLDGSVEPPAKIQTNPEPLTATDRRDNVTALAAIRGRSREDRLRVWLALGGNEDDFPEPPVKPEPGETT